MHNGFKRIFLIKVSRLLRAERLKRNWSMAKVSKKTGITVAILDSMEAGYCSDWDLLVRLAGIYGKKIRFALIDGVPPEYSEEEEA